jgi:chromosome segregation ATPase
MVDVDSVLLSVQERDKWRRRMELLVRSLEEIRERRRRAEDRLRRVKQELSRLRTTGDAMVDMRRRSVVAEVPRGTTAIPYSGR